MPFLPPNQLRQSTEGILLDCTVQVFSTQVYVEHSDVKIIVVEVCSFVEQRLIV